MSAHARWIENHFWRYLSVTKADSDETCGNSSDKPPRASYTAQGLQKQPEIFKNLLYVFLNRMIGFQTFGAGSRKDIPRIIQI